MKKCKRKQKSILYVLKKKKKKDIRYKRLMSKVKKKQIKSEFSSLSP